MSDTIDLTKAKIRRWDLYVAGVIMGWIGEPEFMRVLKLKAIAPKQYYEQAMGDRIVGVDMTMKVNLMQHERAKLALCCPWFIGDPATESIPLMPAALGQDVYDWAVQVVLHPRDRASGTGYLAGGYDSHEDIVMPKAVCLGDFSLKDTDTETPLPMMWKIYPIRSLLPAMSLAYVGPATGEAEPYPYA